MAATAAGELFMSTSSCCSTGEGLGDMPDPEVVQGLNLPTVGRQRADPVERGSETSGRDPPAMEGLSTGMANPPEATNTGGEEAVSLPFIKLVTKIQKGDFVDMAELLRDNLEAIRWGGTL